MLLFPAKMKFKKYQKQIRRFKGQDFKFCFPHSGVYGLKAKKNVSSRVKSNHLESLRLFLQRKLKKKNKVKQYFCFFPDLPVTKKSSGIRMGKGKGSIEFWCFPLVSGRLIIEMKRNVTALSAKFNLLKSSKKLPFSTKVVTRKKFHF